MKTLIEVLKKHQNTFSRIYPFDIESKDIIRLDLSNTNKFLSAETHIDTHFLNKYIKHKLELAKAKIAIGGYLEDRIIYKKSTHFGLGNKARTVHLGMDIWCDEYTPIHAPLNGQVHSFKNNQNFGDYGPTIIIEHILDEVKFYTLYGHLSKQSIENLSIGQYIKAGEAFAEIGNNDENGDWPSHLHFQLIDQIDKYKGDYPGVCTINEVDLYKQNCLDPELILRF